MYKLLSRKDIFLLNQSVVMQLVKPNKEYLYSIQVTQVTVTLMAKAMVTSSNGNISRVTGPLCGEFTDHRWIPPTNARDSKPWCFVWSAPEYAIDLTLETPVIWDANALIMPSL